MNVSLRGCQKHWAEARQLFEAGGELGVSEAYLDFLGWGGGSRGTELSEGHKDPLSDASSWPGC